MRVLLISQYLVGGGLERMVHLLGEELAKGHGCEVHLVAFDSIDDPILRERLEAHGVHCHYWPKGRGFSWALVKRLVSFIRKNHIDVIHTHESAPLIYGSIARILSLRPMKLIHTQHSFIHLRYRPFIRHYDRLFQWLSTRLTVVSSQVRDEYASLGVPEGRVLLVPNGVEFPQHALAPAARPTLRKELVAELAAGDQDQKAAALHLEEALDSRWFISLARLHPQKGQDHLIHLWGQLAPETRAHSVLLLLGPETSPGTRKKLEALAATGPDSRRVLFLGRSRTPTRWLQASDIFLSASEYEGMPLAPIEAGGAGLPMILSDIQGHQILSGQARFFPYADPAQGARLLEEELKALETGKTASRLSAMAADIRARHSGAAMAGTYMGLYSGRSSKLS